jgi:hypothetical protein
MTFDEIMKYLSTDPELFWRLKEEMLIGKVAGPWVDFDSSWEARKRRVGNRSVVRFTPVVYSDHMSSGVVAAVTKKIKQQEPWPGEIHGEDEEFESAHAAWKAEETLRTTHPWRWECKMLIDPTPVVRHEQGAAVSKEEAMALADNCLKGHGWSLPMSNLERLAAAKEAG